MKTSNLAITTVVGVLIFTNGVEAAECYVANYGSGELCNDESVPSVKECPIHEQPERCKQSVKICRDSESYHKVFRPLPAMASYKCIYTGLKADCCEESSYDPCYTEQIYHCVQGDVMITCSWNLGIEGNIIPVEAGGTHSAEYPATCLDKNLADPVDHGTFVLSDGC